MRRIKPQNIFSFENLLLFILYVITLYPLTRTGFLIADDIDLYSHCFTGHWHLLISDTFLRQGRFYLVFMRYVFTLPYLIHSHLWFLFWYITPIALCFVLFARLIKRLFNNQAIVLLCLIFFACTFQIIGWHSITTCYPFYFTFAFALLLWAFHLFLSYYEKNKKKYLFLSAVVMFCASLFYESLLLYYLLFALIALWKRKTFSIGTKESFLCLLKDLIPFIIGGAIYLTAYFTFQIYYPPIYKGVNFSDNITLWGFLQTAYQMQREAFPLQVYKLHRGFLELHSTFNDGAFSLFRSEGVFYLSSLFASILFVLFAHKYNNTNQEKKLSYKTLGVMFLCGVVLIYLPLIFVCLSNAYYLNWVGSYVPTFYTFFGFTLMFLALIIALLNISAFNKWFNNIIVTIISVLVFITTLTTHSMNEAVSKDIGFSSIRIQMATTAFESKIIPNINSSTCICLEQLSNTTSISGLKVLSEFFSWQEFFHKETGFRYNIYDKYSIFFLANGSNNDIVWTAFFKQTTKDEDALLYFAANNGSTLPVAQENIICDSLVGLYHSPYKTFNISIVSQEACDSVWVNGILMNSNGTYHNLNISCPIQRGKENSIFTIKGKGLIASTLSVSNILMQKRKGEFELNNLSEYDLQIKGYIKDITSNQGWLESVKQKAKDQNITLERALFNDAIWLYEQKQEQKNNK